MVVVKCWNLGVFISPWAEGANPMIKAMIKNEISQPKPSELDLVCGDSPYVLAITIRVLSAWFDTPDDRLVLIWYRYLLFLRTA